MNAQVLTGLLLTGVVMAAAQTAKFKKVGSIERLDSAVDAILPADAAIEKVGDECKWTEGPIWVRGGYLLFADIPNNRIMKWTPDGRLSVFMQPSGYTGAEPYKGIEPGSNGMTMDARGRVTVAGHAARNVWRFESLKSKAPDSGFKVTVLADKYQGKRLNSPNDLVYRSDGSLYFTDPPYGLETQADNDPKKDLTFNGVFRIRDALSHPSGAAPDPGKLDLLISDLTRPNGIAFSPDEKVLYIAVSDPQRKVWMRYDVRPDGTVTNGKVLLDSTSSPGEGGPDGIKVDRNGNIYGAGPGGVWVFTPQGKHLATLRIGEKVANCNWGDADAKTLYITASTSVYRIRMKIAGIRP